jgi:acetyl esterase/lipase
LLPADESRLNRRNVSEKYPPTLLLHGDKDTDVPFEQSEQMAQELKRYGDRAVALRRSEFGRDVGSDSARLEVNEQFPRRIVAPLALLFQALPHLGV